MADWKYKLVKKALAEMEDEALKDGVDITSSIYKRALGEAKARLLKQFGLLEADFQKNEPTSKEETEEITEKQKKELDEAEERLERRIDEELEKIKEDFSKELVVLLNNEKKETEKKIESVKREIKQETEKHIEKQISPIESAQKELTQRQKEDRQKQEELKKDLAEEAGRIVYHDDLKGFEPDQHHAEKHTLESHKKSDWLKNFKQLTSGKNADKLHTHKLKTTTIFRGGGGVSEDWVMKYVSDNAGGGVATFLELTDAPDAYTDQALKYVRVNAGEDALEFATLETDYLKLDASNDPLTAELELPSIDVTDETNAYKIDGVMILNNEGTGNIFVGEGTRNGDAGIANTFLGCRAGYNNDHVAGNTGYYNVYIGWGAGLGSVIGVNNTGMFNAAIGANALAANTSGNNNYALGYAALYKNRNGKENTAVGTNSLYNNVSGNYNVGIGNYSLLGATGSNNVGIGNYTGFSAGAASGNIFVGYHAAFYQTASNLLVIDNQLRANLATEITNAILYGVMAATPANQTLRINAAVSVFGSLTAQDHGTAATDEVINVCYGTGEPPAANTTTEGTLYVTYTA